MEISGQTGVVDEVGLRTTRLRNYFGQQVVIPNRAIAVVGNFRRQSLSARIDIGFKNKHIAEAKLAELHKIGRELSVQFNGTILRSPSPPTLLQLQTDEVFARLLLDLWPQQQAFAEKEILPRLRDLLKGVEGEDGAPTRVVMTFSGRK